MADSDDGAQSILPLCGPVGRSDLLARADHRRLRIALIVVSCPIGLSIPFVDRPYSGAIALAAIVALGVFMAGKLSSTETRRSRELVQSIRSQLESRPDTSSLWSTDPETQRTAALVCTTIAEELEWPNPFYIPADPLRLLLLSGLPDWHAATRVVSRLQHLTGRKIDWTSDINTVFDFVAIFLPDR